MKKTLFVILLISFASIYASESFLDLSPATPYVGDTVKLQLIKGFIGVECLPEYNNTSYTVETIDEFSRDYAITLQYEEEMKDPSGCNSPQLTKYGPLFTITGLAVGTYTINDGEQEAGSFSVKEPITITGIITDDPYPEQDPPEPITNAFIELTQWEDGETGIRITTKTDENGNFRLKINEKGMYQVKYWANGYQSQNTYMYVNNDTSLTIRLMRGNGRFNVEGKVVAECAGPNCFAPVRGSKLTVRMLDCFQMYPDGDTIYDTECESFIATTNRNGEYSFSNIPLQKNNQAIYISVTKEGYKPVKKVLYVSKNDNKTLNFVLEEEYPNKDSVVVDGVVFGIATDKDTFNFGETMSMRYTITNRSNGDVSYEFPSACHAELRVLTKKRGILLAHEEDSTCTPGATSLTIRPNEKVSFFFSYRISNRHYMDVSDKLVVAGRLIGYNKSTAKVEVDVIIPVRTIRDLTRKSKTSVRFSQYDRKLLLVVDRDQFVAIDAFNLTGERMPQLCSKRHYRAGSHIIPFAANAIANGTIIVNVKGKTFSATKRVTIIGSR